MTRQRGQALVEFAFTTPLMFLMVFGLIYGAVIFMDYLNFSNHARTVAREIAVTTDADRRDSLVADYNTEANSTFARFYTVTRKITYRTTDGEEATPTDTDTVKYVISAEVKDADGNVTTPEKTAGKDDLLDVVVTVNFDRDNLELPWVLYRTGFPPKHFAIKYTMKLEKIDYSS